MLELLAYLRENGFKTFIVTGGDIDFMRPWIETIYGMLPEQVVGSMRSDPFRLTGDGTPVINRSAKVEFVDDGPGKPVGIHNSIGSRPIFAAGNSDGDLQMLQWTRSAPAPRSASLCTMTTPSANRPTTATHPSATSTKRSTKRAPGGWLVDNMKRDWKVIYPFEK